MRLINLPEILRIKLLEDSDTSYIVETMQGEVHVSESGLEVSSYGTWFWNRREIEILGKTYRIFCEDQTVPASNSLKSGMCKLVDDEGNHPNVLPEILDLLITADNPKYHDSMVCGDKLWGTIFNMETYETKDTLADLSTGNIKSTTEYLTAGRSILLQDRVIGYDSRGENLICIDHNLQPIWQYKPEGSFNSKHIIPPIVLDDLVIQYFGHKNVSTTPGPILQGHQFQDNVHFHEGMIYAVDLNTGDEKWSIEIPNAIDSMTIRDRNLYACSVNEIFVINAATGETLYLINTGLSKDYNRTLYASFLHIHGPLLFFAHPADACILVYSLTELEMVRRIDIPSPYTVKELMHKTGGENMLFFNLAPHSLADRYHMSPLLEINTAQLDGDIECVNSPYVNIELKPSNKNPEQLEIWISIDNVALDKAMLYAELHTENQAFYHGHQGEAYGTVHKTYNFNGMVHLCYSSSDEPEQLILEKMAVLENRFKKWASEYAFASTDPTQVATLETEYLG